MIKTMKKTGSTYSTIDKHASVLLIKENTYELIHITCAKSSDSHLRFFPDQLYRLEIMTPSGKSETHNKNPRVGHLLENGSELLVTVKNDRIFCNIPNGWKKY